MDLLQGTFAGRVISRRGVINWLTRSCDLTPPFYGGATLKTMFMQINLQLLSPEKPTTTNHTLREGHLNDVVFHTNVNVQNL